MHTTTPKGIKGYDQYTVSNDCSCRTYFCCFPLALANICPWPLVPFFQISLENRADKTTHQVVRFPYFLSRGGSRGRVQGVCTPPTPCDDLRLSKTSGILPKKNMWFIGVEVEQRHPLLKKNPGSAPAIPGFPHHASYVMIYFPNACQRDKFRLDT